MSERAATNLEDIPQTMPAGDKALDEVLRLTENAQEEVQRLYRAVGAQRRRAANPDVWAMADATMAGLQSLFDALERQRWRALEAQADADIDSGRIKRLPTTGAAAFDEAAVTAVTVTLHEELSGLAVTVGVEVSPEAWARASQDLPHHESAAGIPTEAREAIHGQLLRAARSLVEQWRPQLLASLETAACELLERQLEELRASQSSEGGAA